MLRPAIAFRVITTIKASESTEPTSNYVPKRYTGHLNDLTEQNKAQTHRILEHQNMRTELYQTNRENVALAVVSEELEMIANKPKDRLEDPG